MAERRAVYWEQVPRDWAEYDVLLGVADCSAVGKAGWLAIGSEIKSALVVDCESQAHRGTMNRNGLLADVNLRERGEALLVLK